MKNLKKYIGTYRVIAYYVYDFVNRKYFFPDRSQGIDEEEFCIPLNLTKRNKDWFSMSHLYIDDGKMCIYIPNTTVGKNIYNKLMEKTEIYYMYCSDGDVNIKIPSDSLDNHEIAKILKPIKSGRSFPPKSIKNLPTNDDNYDYKIHNIKKYNELIALLNDKFGNKYYTKMRTLYKIYNDKYNSNLKDEYINNGYKSCIHYIDHEDIYDKFIEIINKF